ncbi:transposase, IS605 OrfB family [Alkalithermobacter thermoalcaliphilus JW-YL-7 = DSM 7308]|uniref:Transposase, IS605 OrfB family n=2 Tax=Alkalithermobacter thermoalcaliphilus JW-YL-7 = DSM 7308 TaxID=1121328 RepID=A0A150FMT3_CLOPD|nr:transposase, IS605 OrfB family [[Clostridium] paradoxum JW-YL-7 = DSM 7308]
MIKTYKVKLLPNNKQRTKLFECASVARWAYNFALATQQENYKNGGKFLNDCELRKRLTQLKKQKEYTWLNNYSNNITKQAIKDACIAYKNFFEGRANFPKFKLKKKSKPSFYQDTISTGQKYKNINKTSKIKKLEKRQKRLQKRLSKKYELNKIQMNGGEYRYRKTNNIKKLEFLVLKMRRRLKNIRHNYIHQITTSLVKAKPEYVVMENLNTYGMLKNKRLSKSIQEQLFYEFKRQMEYKCALNDIKFILADTFYPSSKTCSRCGALKNKLSLSERTFICDECGHEIDRDLNASINLKNYGKSIA